MEARFVSALFLMVAIAACGGSSLSPSPVANQVTPVVVTWAGTTAQGKGISFSAAGNAVTNVNFGIELPSDSCGGGLTAGAGGPLLGAIVDGRFTAGSTFGSELQWSLNGRFPTVSTAEGALTVNYTRPMRVPEVPACSASVSVTWTATKTS